MFKDTATRWSEELPSVHPPGWSRDQSTTCFAAAKNLLLPGAVAAVREALHHLHVGRQSHERRLLCAIFPPGGPQPPSRLLGVPSCFCNVGSRRLRHFGPCGVGLVLRPGSFSAYSSTEHVDLPGGSVHHAAACELLVWFLRSTDGDQPPLRLQCWGADVCGVRGGALDRGCGAHDGWSRATAAHREQRGTFGDTSVR